MAGLSETIHCSNCKRDILSSNFVIHDLHCQRNIYLCLKCNEPINHNDRTEHDKAKHVAISCTNCHNQVEKWLLKKHLDNDCPNRKVKCQICDIDVQLNDISEHENYCGSRTEKCSECGEFVMLKYKQLHIDSNHTFIKLSDEPGPSPSWQNGRRTLGQFFPSPTSNSRVQQSHHKKNSGRGVGLRNRLKESYESVESVEKPKLTPPSSNRNKITSFQSPISSPSGSQGYKMFQEAIDCEAKIPVNRELYSNVVGLCGNKKNDVDSGKMGISTEKEKIKKGKESLLKNNTSDKSDGKSNSGRRQKEFDIESDYMDDDVGLALAIQLSRELNDDFQLENNKLIAQAIEENTAVLSEFSLLDSLEKKKPASKDDLTKNMYIGENSSKTTLKKSQLGSSLDDSYDDDELLLYSKQQGEMNVDNCSLPCQFCGSLFPSYALMDHQTYCNYYEGYTSYRTERYHKKHSLSKNDKH